MNTDTFKKMIADGRGDLRCYGSDPCQRGGAGEAADGEIQYSAGERLPAFRRQREALSGVHDGPKGLGPHKNLCKRQTVTV